MEIFRLCSDAAAFAGYTTLIRGLWQSVPVSGAPGLFFFFSQFSPLFVLPPLNVIR